MRVLNCTSRVSQNVCSLFPRSLLQIGLSTGVAHMKHTPTQILTNCEKKTKTIQTACNDAPPLPWESSLLALGGGFWYVLHKDKHPECLTSVSVCMPACLSAYLPVCLPICLTACLPVCLSRYLSVCLPICLTACWPVCLSV